MNERIDQLRLEAGISRLHDEPKFMVAVSKEGTVIEPLDGLEKFAELIVEECMEVSLKYSHRDDDMGAIIAKQIKQHFGIEE